MKFGATDKMDLSMLVSQCVDHSLQPLPGIECSDLLLSAAALSINHQGVFSRSLQRALDGCWETDWRKLERYHTSPPTVL